MPRPAQAVLSKPTFIKFVMRPFVSALPTEKAKFLRLRPEAVVQGRIWVALDEPLKCSNCSHTRWLAEEHLKDDPRFWAVRHGMKCTASSDR